MTRLVSRAFVLKNVGSPVRTDSWPDTEPDIASYKHATRAYGNLIKRMLFLKRFGLFLYFSFASN